jgi:hypothetical protein
MLILSLMLIMLIQSTLGEFLGDSNQLIRLWLLPIIAIAFESKKVRVLPVIGTGLLVDGLYGAPTGFHVLELGLLYALLSLAIEHLGHRTFVARALLGAIVGALNLVITIVLGYCFSVMANGEYLLEHVFELLILQSLSMGLLLPMIVKLLASPGAKEHRLNVGS